jgi:hypothetical protein
MWISNGDNELAENIVHLVLAKIPDDDGKLVPGTRGISLFIVPKKLVDEKGELTGERNDVALAGLNHKLGYRGIPNTLLNFGEGKHRVRGGGLDGVGSGAIGYLVGKPGEGLRCMFHMMNEARIAVGLGATMLGYAGYEISLDYAKGRPQGRPTGVGGKDPSQPQVPIIEHADVKRMLLAQKSYCEARSRSSSTAPARRRAAHRRRRRPTSREPAARGADADRQELAERMVPRGEQPRDPGARRLRLHARLPGRAVLARQPPQHDPRGHARHPGARPARAQGRDGRRRRAHAARRDDRGDDRPRRAVPRSRRTPRRSPPRSRSSSRRRARRGRRARRRRRSPTRRRTCRRSATSPSPGSGSTSRSAPPRRPTTRRSAAGSPRAATSSTTSCRRSAPGSASSRAATTPAGRWPRTGFEARPGRVEILVWVLIYGGLLVFGLGVALSRGGLDYGWSVSVVGIVLAVAGVVLVYVRSRMADRRDA